MIKKHLLNTLICLGMTQLVLAEDEPEITCCPSVVIGEPLDPCCINPMYPYPATFSPCDGWNLYAKGEFLYMSYLVDNIKQPVWNTAVDLSDVIIEAVKTGYRPGFRVALGLDLGSVILDATYLRYHSHSTSSYRARENGGIGLFLLPPSMFANLFFQGLPLFQNTKTISHILLDIGIISVQRPVYIGKRIMMNLNYGIMGLWSGQDWRSSTNALTNPIPPVVTSSGVFKLKNRAWAVGPNLGFTATALLPWKFQAIASIDLALQYGSQYKTKSSSSFPDYPVVLANNKFRQRGDAAHVQSWHSGELGIAWGDYFFCDRYYVNVSVSYLWFFQHIFLQNPPFNPLIIAFATSQNFSIHGISVGGRLDF